MASIASITTFGFGSYSTINLAVTLGYGIGANTTDTHDYPADYVKKYRETLRAQEALLRAREEEKVAQREALRQQLDDLLHPKPNIEPERVASKKKAVKQTNDAQEKAYLAKQNQLSDTLQLLQIELNLLSEERKLVALEIQKQRNASAIKAILLAISAPFEELKQTLH